MNDDRTARLILHEDPISANCYKVRLVAAHLGIVLERRAYAILKGETRTPAFLSTVNANGRIPTLQVDDRFLPESNAACWYLAEGTAMLPDDRFGRADTLRWMFFEQYNHEPNVATLRYWLTMVGGANLTDAQRAAMPGKRAAGEAALDLMDAHLRDHAFFVYDRFGLADVALYAYSHVMEDGGFVRGRWPAVARWIDRVAALPGHVPFDG